MLLVDPGEVVVAYAKTWEERLALQPVQALCAMQVEDLVHSWVLLALQM